MYVSKVTFAGLLCVNTSELKRKTKKKQKTLYEELFVFKKKKCVCAIHVQLQLELLKFYLAILIFYFLAHLFPFPQLVPVLKALCFYRVVVGAWLTGRFANLT